MPRLETLTAVDLGTSKVVCIIAELDDEGELEIVARGVCPCLGMSRGSLVDPQEALRSLETAVTKAEKVAGYPAGPAVVGLSGGSMWSQPSQGVWPVGNSEGEVTPFDVDRAVRSAGMVGIPSDQEILHVIPRGFAVDGKNGIRNPVGLAGLRLEVEALVVASSHSHLQNIQKCVQKAGLELHPDGPVAQSIASSLAVLTEEERDLGVAMLDVGHGTVDFAAYEGGEIGHSAVLPIGGEVLISDLTKVFLIPPREAERLLLDIGSAFPAAIEGPDTEAEAVTVSNDGTVPVSRHKMAEVLEARLMDVFDWVKEQVERSRAQGVGVTSLVMTGGASQLPGMAALAHRCVGLPTRVAAPCYPPGLPSNLASPIYSTAVGLLLYAAGRRLGGPRPAAHPSWFHRVGRWFTSYLQRVF